MAVIIKTVTTRKELKTFVKFANKLYKGNPYYVPCMPADDMNTLDKTKNGAFEFCEAECYLAYKDDKLVGRFAAPPEIKQIFFVLFLILFIFPLCLILKL